MPLSAPLALVISWQAVHAVQQQLDPALVSQSQKLVRRAAYIDGWKSSRIDSGGFVESQIMDQPEPLAFTVKVNRALPHQKKPWTQGLEFTSDGKRLIETSGSYPSTEVSYIRTLDATTGEELMKTSAGLEGAFVEGITELNGLYYAITYHDRRLLTYDHEFKLLAMHTFPMHEGWGLTQSTTKNSLLVTNGSAWLTTIRVPEGGVGDFLVSGAKQITCFGKPVSQVNELEMVDDFMGLGPTVLGNIMNTRLVLLIDPESAYCKGVLSLSDGHLEAIETKESEGLHVANGIAFNKATGRFIVTGKNWDQMFDVSVIRSSSGEATSCLKSHLLLEVKSAENPLRCR